MSKDAIKRIVNKDMKEIQKMNLSELGIHIEFNEENMMKATAIIIGPKDTPYENGILYFLIEFPTNYPFSPPKIGYLSSSRYRIHPNLLPILERWKKIHTRHFTPSKISWVFPTLMKTEDYIVPVCDRTIREMLNLAYNYLGFAKVNLVGEKGKLNKIGAKRVVVEWSKFGTSPTRTFRHFAATCLWDAQNSNVPLTDNFVCNYIGHKDPKFSKGLYGKHKNLRGGAEHQAQIDKALINAIPLTTGVSNEN